MTRSRTRTRGVENQLLLRLGELYRHSFIRVFLHGGKEPDMSAGETAELRRRRRRYGRLSVCDRAAPCNDGGTQASEGRTLLCMVCFPADSRESGEKVNGSFDMGSLVSPSTNRCPHRGNVLCLVFPYSGNERDWPHKISMPEHLGLSLIFITFCINQCLAKVRCLPEPCLANSGLDPG